MAGCEKWRAGCHHCPQFGSDFYHLLDNSWRMYRLKKQWLAAVVEKDDMDALEREIICICNEYPHSREASLHRAEQFNICI